MRLWRRWATSSLRCSITPTARVLSASCYSTMARTYEDAITALNTLQSNFATVNAIRQAGKSLNLEAMPEMREWCQRLGYQPSDFNRLNPIHIAGTKGKGSTCAFISSILSQYLLSEQNTAGGQRTLHKIGLFTSPHLRFVRERIQINNTPLSEADFAKYFFETWDRLEAAAKAAGEDSKLPESKPVYFRFLTLMAFHTYMREGVDAAIIETGIGGEYDYTNILEKPVVTGITSLGIDHVPMLGTTIEEIAWQKAGIMKPGALAYTAPQPQGGALGVLRDRAKEKGVPLQVATGHPEHEPGNPAAIKLGLSGDVQYVNAELAACVAGGFLRQLGFPDIPSDITTSALPAKFRRGLETAKLGGRFDRRLEGNIAWHIDGGHTLESIETTGKWYASETAKEASSSESTHAPPKFRVLIFNQQTRDSNALARALHKTLSEAAGSFPFTHAVFCTNVTFKQAGYTPDLVSMNTSAPDVDKLSVQKNLAKVWKELSPNTDVAAMGTIEEAVEFVRNLGAEARTTVPTSTSGATADNIAVSVLVTGSLHLVGGLIDVIETVPGKK